MFFLSLLPPLLSLSRPLGLVSLISSDVRDPRLRFSLSSLLRWFNYSLKLRCQAFSSFSFLPFGSSRAPFALILIFIAVLDCYPGTPSKRSISYPTENKKSKKKKTPPKNFPTRKRKASRQVLSVKTVFTLPFICEGHYGCHYSTDSVCL